MLDSMPVMSSGGGGESSYKEAIAARANTYQVYKSDDTTATSSEYLTVTNGTSYYALVTPLKDFEGIVGGVNAGTPVQYKKISFTAGVSVLLNGQNGTPAIDFGYSATSVMILVL